MGSLLRKLATNFWKPTWWRQRAIPFAADQFTHAYYDYFRTNRGTYVINEEWDNLIILDGCRYDVFSEVSDLDYPLESRISRGASSLEFVEENFTGRQLYDTIYVTANPFVDKVASDAFHAVVDVWDYGWDSDLHTVTPEKMVEEILKVRSEYPDKHLITHFMQPHHPFIGERGRSIIKGQTGFKNTRKSAKDEPRDDHTRVWYHLLQDGEITAKEAWSAYKENLEVTLPHVKQLIEVLPNRTVVTADHGNLFDEPVGPLRQRMSGHPTGIHTEALVKVPWLVSEGPRRKVSSEATASSTSLNDPAYLEKRLAHLGYRG